MNLTSPHPFWLMQDGLLASYPPLEEDVSCDVAILGAGITGALVADRLASEGHNVVVLDGRDVGQGSTVASTSILQYEIDVELRRLIELIGREDACRAYQLCLNSIGQLEELSACLPVSGEFARRKSLYVAHYKKHVPALREEFEARKACGIRVEFLEAEALRERFSLDFAAAILSHDAGVCNAYRMTHGLLQRGCGAGVKVFDRTEVTAIEHRRGEVILQTDRAAKVRAKHVVFATGYESQLYLEEKIVELKSTYAIVTQPLADISPWKDEWLFWETARPYLYFRTTSDGRLLAGGEDDDFRNPKRRDASIAKKAKLLEKQLRRILPDVQFEVEYAWAGTFGETKDGLAYVDHCPKHDRCYFALGFGGNGITFSIVAANILCDLIAGKKNDDARLFRFGR